MKKILFIITKSEMGGASRFLFELVSRLDRKKYDILAAAGPNSVSQNPGELFEKLKGIGIKTVYLPHQSNTLGIKTLLAFWEIYRLIKDFEPDILHLNSSEAGFLGSFAGGLYRLPPHPFLKGEGRKNMKIIYRIGGWAFKEPRNIFFRKIYLWAEKISAPFKDVIVTNSEFDRKLAIKNKIVKPEKIITVYNGLDFHKLKFLPKETARKCLYQHPSAGGPMSLPLIGAIALLYKNKGLEYLILAAKKLKESGRNWHFMIIGKGAERQNLEKLIIKHGLENTVYLVGAIPDAYRFLKAFDLFVLPSVKEGQPWVILEAMAAGLPIVATNIAGIPEMIENEKSGLLVEPADSEALASAILKMMTHPSLAHECARNALVRVKEKFSAKDMMRETEKLFR